jgi:D-amino-acid dehydrogenase
LSNSEKIWPVVVIGGGIVGICSALALLKSHPQGVLVVDPLDEFARASYGNAGVVSPASVFPVAGPGVLEHWAQYAVNADAGVRLRYRELPKIVPWLQQFLRHSNAVSRQASAQLLRPLTQMAWQYHQALASDLGTESLLAAKGWIRLYAGQASWTAAQNERAALRDMGVSLVDLIDGQLHELEPTTRQFAYGSLVQDAGSVIRPEQLVRACHQAFVARGGVVYKGKVDQISPDSNSMIIKAQTVNLLARTVVVAAGASSGRLLSPFKLRMPYAAERGYHQPFAFAAGRYLNRPCYDVECGYVVSPINITGDQVRVLSGIELGTPNMKPQHQMIQAAVAKATARFGLTNEALDVVWHGDRPSTPDGLPVLGPLKVEPRVICAFGHGHIGLSTGPITGQIVAALVNKQKPPVSNAGFLPERFTSLAA